MKSDKSALYRLAKAYPDAFNEEAGRAKPFYEVSCKKSVLNHMDDVTKNPMGRAITLAVLLDQMDSGEFPTNAKGRQRAAASFEEAFNALTDLKAPR